MLSSRRRILLAALSAVLLLTGCSDDDDDGDVSAAPTDDGHGHAHSVGPPTENFAFTLGRPPDPGTTPEETIEVRTMRGFRFEPGEVEVAAGETVRFVVENTDKVPHEFVLGNEPYQQVHDSQASSGGVPHDYSAYSVHVDPGQTRSFEWKFDRSGRVLFACHVPGHYERGMIGEIRIG